MQSIRSRVDRERNIKLPGFCLGIQVYKDATSWWENQRKNRIGSRGGVWKARGRMRSRVPLRSVQLEIPEKYLRGDISWATSYESEVQKKGVD